MEVLKEYSGPFAFFKKHFNGDYSLGRSYWVNTFLLSMFAPLLGVLILPWLSENFPARYSSMVVLALTAFGVVAWIWAASGTWASANKHVSRGGKQGWASAAKIAIILGVLRTIGDLASISNPLGEHWKVATGWQIGPNVVFEVRADGKSMLVKGGINDGVAEELEKALAIAPSVETVVLDSSGGWVRQGNLIAEVISSRGLNTYVENECSSACTLAFLAGKQRAAEPDAKIGFHSFRSIGKSEFSIDQSDIDLAEKSYLNAGLSREFIGKIVATPSKEMWYPSHDMLLKEGVLTRQSLGGETAIVSSSKMSRQDLINEFKQISAFNSLSQKYPDEFDNIINKAWEQIELKKSDGDVMNAGKNQVGELVGKLLPIASDSSLIEFNNTIYNQVIILRDKNAEACVEVVFPSGKPINTNAWLTPEVLNDELKMLNNMILGSDINNRVKYTQEESEKAFIRVLSPLDSNQINLLISPDNRYKSLESTCTAVVAYLESINSIPESERAEYLRVIYSSE